MKQLRVLVLVGLLIGVMLPVFAQRRSPGPDDRMADVERLMVEWQDAMRSADGGRIAPFYWEDALRIFVFPGGGRHVIEGIDAIVEQQEAAFRQARRDDPAAFRQYALPEPEIMGMPDRLPIFIYRSPEDGSLQIFQFEERGGRVAIYRHAEIIRAVEPVEAREDYAWADEDRNGILEPPEQKLVLNQFLALAHGPHRVRGFLDTRFDWNGDDAIDEQESERALTILFRDGLRHGYQAFPEFSESFVDLDRNGFVSIQEADLAVTAAFRDELPLPRPITVPIDERLDMDMDGWIIPAEVDVFTRALTRAVASVPVLSVTSPTTPTTVQWAIWWADANESGFVDEPEIMDVGVVLQQLMSHTTIASNPIELHFDVDGDFMISPDERQAARDEILSRVPDGERDQLIAILEDPERLIGRRPADDLQRLMDNDPRDGKLVDYEVFGFLERRFAAIAETWFTSGEGVMPEVVEIPPEDRPSTPVDSTPEEAPRAEAGEPVVAVKVPTLPATTTDQVGTELSIAVELRPVYPVLRKYYDTAPLGSVTLTNTSEKALTDIDVSLALAKYIDQPRVYDTLETLAAGESAVVDLTLLFNSDVLDITEGDRVDATITVSYTGAGGQTQESATETMIFYDRNAIRWDDTRKVAAFVTERDQEIRSFARRAIAGARGGRNAAVDDAFQDAMVLFIAMVDSNLMYFRDPSSSYAAASSNGTTIDYLQFPRQTLVDYGGDCDDLSVAYNALLESVGRRTAFITVPGHIMSAVALQMRAAEARSAFMDPTDLVFDDDGTVWVPVETTALESSFYEAWQQAAKTYRQYSGSGQAELIATDKAWEVYGSEASVVNDEVESPDQEQVTEEFSTEISTFVNTQIASRELQIQADLQDYPGDRRLLNRLGVLYAQYGLWDKAKAQFESIVETEEYIPALLNLGNIAFLDGDYETAVDYYDEVLDLQPTHPTALLAAARANHELENYGNVRTLYGQLRQQSPRLAADYSYLDLTSSNDTARAQAADELKGRVLWEESDEEDGSDGTEGNTE